MDAVGLGRASSNDTRTSSPEDSSNASASPGRSPRVPTSSCGRADLGARCLDPGADHEPPGEAARERTLTYLFISHDLRAIRHLSDRIAVMYLGKMVELCDAKEPDTTPLMPYTKALLSAVPIPNPKVERARRRIVLEGDVASPINPPTGHFIRAARGPSRSARRRRRSLRRLNPTTL